MQRKRLLSIIIFGCALAGVAANFLLSYERHFRDIAREINREAGVVSSVTRSLCGDAQSFVNCERVDRSPHARFLSIPQTSWGMMYFLAMLFFIIPLFFLYGGAQRAYLAILFWPLLFGSLYSLYMCAVSFFAIRALCPLCMVSYAANWISLGVLIVDFVKSKENPINIKDELRNLRAVPSLQWKVVLAAYLCIALCAAIPAGLFLDFFVLRLKANVIEKRRSTIIDAIVAEFSAQNAVELQPSFVCAIGNPSAPVVIVEFSDLLCPHCKKAYEFIKQATAEFGDRVRVVFMNVPLESKCNSQVKKDVHPGACLLAKGAICAARQSAFATYMEHAFNLHPKNTGIEQMRQLAVISGLHISTFESCLASSDTENELKKQIDEAHRLNIHSTPTIIINGKILKSWGDTEIIKKAIRMVLEKGQ